MYATSCSRFILKMETEIHVTFLKSDGIVECEVHLILSVTPGNRDDVQDEEDSDDVED